MNRALGIAFTLAGAVMLIIAVINSQKKEEVAHIGPFHLTAEHQEQTNWLPYTGGLFFIGGVVLLVTSKRSH